MQAHEVPWRIFDLIHRAVGSPALAPASPAYRRWQFFEIGLESNRGQARLGYCFSENFGDDSGFTGRLAIWPPNLDGSVRVDDHLLLEVVGEPDCHHPNYKGVVRARVFSQFYFGPEGTVSRASSEEIVSEMFRLTRAVLDDEDLEPLLAYWRAFRTPVVVAPALPLVSV